MVEAIWIVLLGPGLACKKRPDRVARVKLLFIGDIVGEPGRKAVAQWVPRLRSERGVQFVVANGENSAGGSGITPKIAEELFDSGVDVITSGDHLWDQKEVNALLESEPRFLRPGNYPAGVIGSGSGVFEVRGLPSERVGNIGSPRGNCIGNIFYGSEF